MDLNEKNSAGKTGMTYIIADYRYKNKTKNIINALKFESIDLKVSNDQNLYLLLSAIA